MAAMSAATLRLALFTALSAALAMAGSLLSLPALLYVFKPLSTLLIIAHAWPRGRATPGLRRWVIAGLVFSLGGDVALMLGEGLFVVGLLCFLAAHLCYLWAFTRVQRLAAWPWAFVGYGLLAGAVLSQLWPGVPSALHGPVMAYVLCLAAMAAQAAVVWRGGRGAADAGARRRSAVLALGGLLFLVSDACLAINKFAGPLPLAALWVLLTYWSAQWCIASWLAPAQAGEAPPRSLR